MSAPIFQPNTAIMDVRGYALHVHEGKPWIVHSYTERVSDEKGTKRPVRRVEHLKLDADAGWGDTATAAVMRVELQKAWDHWCVWNEAMKGGPRIELPAEDG